MGSGNNYFVVVEGNVGYVEVANENVLEKRRVNENDFVV